jgi:hypothetical protein
VILAFFREDKHDSARLNLNINQAENLVFLGETLYILTKSEFCYDKHTRILNSILLPIL